MKTCLTFALLAALASAQEPVRDLCARFARHDVDGDGTHEIEALTWLGEAQPTTPGSLALLLVEERLVAGDEGAHTLRPALDRWAADVAREGRHAVLVSARLHASARHQDGRTLLALRRFLRAVHGERGRLHTVVLVGAFPEAFLVRTVNWRKRTPLALGRPPAEPARWDEPVDYLRTVPEVVAHTCDLVLADLDGRWERRYTEPREELPTLIAAFPGGVPDAGGIARHWERGHVSAEDFFHVNDGHLETRIVPGADGAPPSLHVIPWDEHANTECSAEDRLRPNPIARPEIAVSRIDARGVALAPRPEWLDEEGRPRSVALEEGARTWSTDPWRVDDALERRLLLAYFERNHAFRSGARSDAERPASLAHDLPSGYGELLQTDAAWKALPRDGWDVHGRPDLNAVVAWFRRPALLRTVRAHSDPWGSVFDRPDVGRLEAEFARGLFSWSPQDAQLVPSLRAACAGGKLDFFLLRTMWENGVTGTGASFYLHTGCEAISPPGAGELPYSHAAYGRRNGAQALLFYADGLALVGRAKVFYDEPAQFCRSLGAGHTFGEAWMRTFEIESQAASFDAVGGDIGRKRTYFWSLLGDATLRLRPRSAPATAEGRQG